MTSMARLGDWCVLVCALLSGTAHAADICEPMREQIEVQIAGTGATGFAVIVVDRDANVAGKVVGTCAKGARKLVYVRATNGSAPSDSRPARSPATVSAPAPNKATVITECRDGSVVQGSASCKP